MKQYLIITAILLTLVTIVSASPGTIPVVEGQNYSQDYINIIDPYNVNLACADEPTPNSLYYTFGTSFLQKRFSCLGIKRIDDDTLQFHRARYTAVYPYDAYLACRAAGRTITQCVNTALTVMRGQVTSTINTQWGRISDEKQRLPSEDIYTVLNGQTIT